MATCKAPDCGAEAEGKWCPMHQAILDRVSKEINTSFRERMAAAKRKGRRPVRVRCYYLDCSIYAKPGERYCIYHLQLRESLSSG